MSRDRKLKISPSVYALRSRNVLFPYIEKFRL